MPEITKGAVLEGPFWPEPVRVIECRALDCGVHIQAVGLESKKFYDEIIAQAELRSKVSVRLAGGGVDFSGDAQKFKLALEATRIRLAHQFDPHFAVSVSQIDPLPHQLEDVYHCVLRKPCIRFMLAHDPGAGKTIMAGLVLKELKFRGLAERILIVTPANLADQWRRELLEKFGETFEVITRESIDALYGRNVWADRAQCITSVDFAKQDDVRDMLSDVEWDLVIVDEAHYLAAYRYGERRKETKRYKLGKLLAAKTDHLLFLTATPHRGDPDNFRLLLELLDEDVSQSGQVLAEAAQHGENPLLRRRLKEDMKDFDGKPLFPPRHVNTVSYELSEPEKRLYEAVTEYVTNHFRLAEQQQNRNVGLAMTILQRRLASSLRAIRRSLERRRDRLRKLRKEGLESAQQAHTPVELEDLAEHDRWRYEQEAIERFTLAKTLRELEEEIGHLDRLVDLAKAAERQGTETKLEQLRRVVQSEALASTGKKLLIFTEHRDTLEYLVEKLSDWGFSVTQIHGNMPLPQRVQKEKEFQHDRQIMVATEAAGEGINLQFCSLMVNYDIPWNPNRLEQRMGRIHRYLQREEVHIYNLVASDTREGKVLQRLMEKLEKMRHELGSDRVYDVVGEILPGVSLEDLFREHLAGKRTLEEICALIESVPVDRSKFSQISLESLATRYIDMSRLIEEEQQAKENRLVPEYIEAFFVEAFRSLGGRMERRRDGLWRIAHVPAALRPSFPTPHIGTVLRSYPKVTFRKEQAKRLEETEFLGPGHPLFEAVLEKVLHEYMSALSRGALFIDPDASAPYLLWFLLGEVRDGTGSPVGQRVFAVRQEEQGSVVQVRPSALQDIVPVQPEQRSALPDLPFAPDEEKVISWALDNLIQPFFEEMKQRREREVAIREKCVKRSLNMQISQSQVKLGHYYEQQKKGRDYSAAIRQEENRLERLIARRDRRLKEIERQRHLARSKPQVLGVAAVFPLVTPEPDVSPYRANREVEQAAMAVAMAFERRAGRTPQDVSAEKRGYDIRSEGRDELRCIEVKGSSQAGGFPLTRTEWITAQRLGPQYWLYIVANALTNPRLYLIQNPAAKLKPRERVQIVRYLVAPEQWQRAAQPAEVTDG